MDCCFERKSLVFFLSKPNSTDNFLSNYNLSNALSNTTEDKDTIERGASTLLSIIEDNKADTTTGLLSPEFLRS